MLDNKNKLARIAGFLYLTVVLTGIFSLMYVPKMLFVWDNPVETFENIAHSIRLFRLSVASSAFCYIAFSFLVVVLYQLLRSVNEFMAKLMLILALISVPISFINLQNKYDILDLFSKNPLNIADTSVKLIELLNRYDNGILVVTVFWGLWLFPFGYLVYKSGLFPKFIGIFLMAGCFGYVINFFGKTIFVDYKDFGISQYLGLLPTIGELSICLWLIVKGIKYKKSVESN